MSKVLIVDDDEGLLFLLGEYLDSCGFQFDLANNVKKAREYLRESKYEVIISDLEMPGESGFDLFRYVAALYPEIRFVLMTGRLDSRIRREALRMGIQGYMEKPFRLSDLITLIGAPVSHVCGGRHSTQDGLAVNH